MLINIPIEPIPYRYSVDWDNWFYASFVKNKISVRNIYNIYGTLLTKGIEQGRFLDCIGTNYYKNTQLLQIIELIYKKQIVSGDILFFHDLWFPGIEQIKYIADTMNLNITITGCLHAGSYDPNDFLYQANTGKWAIHFEHMLFALTDLIFVATYYHKNLLLKSRSIDEKKIKVTGFPIYQKPKKDTEKKNIIIFPHRLDPEKNPNYFFDLKEKYKNSDWKFLSTVLEKLSKEEYYQKLNESKIAVSFSDQETWGIAMIESVFADCLPLVPEKLSYKELYLPQFTYRTPFEFQDKLQDFMENYDEYIPFLQKQKKFLIEGGKKAIPNIIKEIKRINYAGLLDN